VKDLQKEFKKRRRLHHRLRLQARLISALNKGLFYVLVLICCAGAYVFSFPQYDILEDKEKVLQEMQGVKQLAENEKDKAVRENRALQEDPKYMELLSRDTLNYYLPGETVFQVNREYRESKESE